MYTSIEHYQISIHVYAHRVHRDKSGKKKLTKNENIGNPHLQSGTIYDV